jgi:EAL domain-containing protein (putative c-di-GMP-specific phosphodiesterase class I)
MSTARDKFVAFAFCWADALIELDPARRVSFASGATRALMGATPESLVGRNFADLLAPKDRVLAEQLLAVSAKRGRIHDAVIHLQTPDGASHPVSFAGYVLPQLKDHHFLALRATKALNAAGEEETDVERDKDSGLMTGESFSARAAQQILESGGAAEMTLVNLPGFNAFYESLSPDEQKVLSSTVGTTLRANSIDGNTAGEIGDGKFGILHAAGLDVTALEQTLTQATRAFDPSGKGIAAQAGTITVDLAGVSEDDLTKGLVYTINHFKEQVGEKFNVKDIAKNMNGLVQEAVQSLNKFRGMVGGNDFQIAFHPILGVRTGAVHHYEALVRFNGRFEESPYKYITFAEETGLIAEFDIAMAKKCVDWLRKNKADRVSVAVNISGMSVDNEAYSKELHRLLDADTWLKDFLLFEITESARVADLNRANAFVQGLRGKGFHVCLDDFGAGAASFQYLSVLEVDVVKLDGSAVKNAQAAPKGRAFLRALTTLCKTLKVETIAEMVDSKEALEFVRDCGVEYVQGFLFGKPDPDPWGFIKKLDRRLFS